MQVDQNISCLALSHQEIKELIKNSFETQKQRAW